MFIALILLLLITLGAITDQIYTAIDDKVDMSYAPMLAPSAQAYRTALQRYLMVNPKPKNSGNKFASISGTDLDPYMPAGYARNADAASGNPVSIWDNRVNYDDQIFIVFASPTTLNSSDVRAQQARNIEADLVRVSGYSVYAGATTFNDNELVSPAPILSAGTTQNFWTPYLLKEHFGDDFSLPRDYPAWIGTFE